MKLKQPMQILACDPPLLDLQPQHMHRTTVSDPYVNNNVEGTFWVS
jgi:hypothetical protein